MNNTLRKAIFKRQRLRNIFEKCRTDKNWDKLRKQRNLVTSLKRKSINNYFLERCVGGQKSGDFWPTIKRFLSKKCKSGENRVVLSENEKIVLNTKEVCDIFNDHYVNVASEIGSDVQFDPTTHESIRKIGENANHELNFDFENTKPNEIDKVLKNISTKRLRVLITSLQN